MKNRGILIFLVFMSLVSLGYGLTANVTEFDDGCVNCNIMSNTTKYLTLLEDVGIRQANLTLKGYLVGYCYQESANTSNQTGIDGNCNLNYSGNYVFKPNYVYINYSRPVNAVGAKWEVKHGYMATPRYNITIPSSCFDDIIQLRMFSYKNQTITNSTSYLHCFNSSNIWEKIGNTYHENSLNGSATTVDYTYINNGNWTDKIFCQYNGFWFKTISNTQLGAMLSEEAMIWDIPYPRDVFIKVNNSIVFNHTGNLTGTNKSINLNKNDALQNCYSSRVDCKIEISASTWGKLELSNLFVQYNKSFLPILNILSPAQIITSVVVGNSFTQNVNISNSGNINATNISFVTVSSFGTPNYNDSLSWSCFDNKISFGNSILCNVTFSSLMITPEPDEKLKVRGINVGTNTAVFSDGIDVDVTLAAAGGGGGGVPGSLPGKWIIRIPANRVINNPYGSYGYSTNPIPIQVYNNQSTGLFFTFSSQGLKCKFENNNFNVEGYSFGNNRVSCDYPIKEDNGKILISAGGTIQSINVYLASNDLGYFFILVSGRSKEYGLLFPIFFFAILLGGVYYVVIKQ